MRLTLQQRERYEKARLLNSTTQKVLPEFQPHQGHKYPEDNKQEFERWFFENTTPGELLGKERIYLPVFWTGYWCNNGYGKKTGASRRLQHFIDDLPRDKKYWSICQYDDGPMVDFKDLDIKIFGMSGGRIDYPIPLLCQPHKFEFPNIKKDIFCSFVGSDTHPIRRKIVKELEGREGYYVTLKKLPLKEYCEILARSVYALCPRGYGPTSFRIAEALHYQAIPVYTSDAYVFPYNFRFDSYGYVIDDPSMIDYELKGGEDLCFDVGKLQNMDAMRALFTYEGCKQKILQNI